MNTPTLYPVFRDHRITHVPAAELLASDLDPMPESHKAMALFELEMRGEGVIENEIVDLFPSLTEAETRAQVLADRCTRILEAARFILSTDGHTQALVALKAEAESEWSHVRLANAAQAIVARIEAEECFHTPKDETPPEVIEARAKAEQQKRLSKIVSPMAVQRRAEQQGQANAMRRR